MSSLVWFIFNLQLHLSTHQLRFIHALCYSPFKYTSVVWSFLTMYMCNIYLHSIVLRVMHVHLQGCVMVVQDDSGRSSCLEFLFRCPAKAAFLTMF